MYLHHLGWAVHSIAGSRAHFETQLGLPYDGEEDFPGLRVAFFGAGSCLLELLQPLDATGEIAVHLRERGEGLHHLAYRVPDVAAALEDAERRGMPRIDAVPRPGARATTIGFVNPGRPDGVLVEYVQVPA